MVAPGDALSIGAGLALTLLAVFDAVQTILHPDLDGWVTKRLNRGVWALFTGLGRLIHGARDALQRGGHSDRAERTLRSWAGPVIVILDVAVWMVLPLVGNALIILPSFPAGFTDDPTVGEGWGPADRFVAAIYYSATTFTTLGYGDFAPETLGGRIWAVLAPLTGLLVVGLSIAYVIAVFEGVDARDAIMLRAYAECGVSTTRTGGRDDDHTRDDGRLDGVHFIVRAYRRGPDHLHKRLEAWSADIRALHGHLYRFHGLAFYLRTRAVRRGPERLMRAFADATLAARVLALREPLRSDDGGRSQLLRDASEHLEDSFSLFAEALLDRGAFVAREELAPAAHETLDRMRARIERELGLEASVAAADDEARLVELALVRARFLAHIEDLARAKLPSDEEAPAGSEEPAPV